jgi:hypothetical protein
MTDTAENVKTALDTALEAVKEGKHVLPGYGVDEHGRCQCGDEQCTLAGRHMLFSPMLATDAPDMARLWFKMYPWAAVYESEPDLPDDGAKRHTAEQEKRKSKFAPRWFDDYVNQEPPEPLFAGFISRVGVGVLSGAKNTYKTFFAIGLGMSVVTRRPFAGFPYVERPDDLAPAVIHLTGEGKLDVETVRVPAWAADRNIEPSAAKLYGVAGTFPDLNLATDSDLFIEAIRESIPAGARLALVEIDTTARLMRGLDENSARDAGKVIVLADRISEELQCFVLLIHHLNASGSRPRGSTVIEDDPSIGIKLTKSNPIDGTIAVDNPFQREGAVAPRFYMKPRKVPVETTAGPRETLVLDKVEGLIPPGATQKTAEVERAIAGSKLREEVGAALARSLTPQTSLNHLVESVGNMRQEAGAPWHGRTAVQIEESKDGLRHALIDACRPKRRANGASTPGTLARFLVSPYVNGEMPFFRLPVSALAAKDVPDELDFNA